MDCPTYTLVQADVALWSPRRVLVSRLLSLEKEEDQSQARENSWGPQVQYNCYSWMHHVFLPNVDSLVAQPGVPLLQTHSVRKFRHGIDERKPFLTHHVYSPGKRIGLFRC